MKIQILKGSVPIARETVPSRFSAIRGFGPSIDAPSAPSEGEVPFRSRMESAFGQDFSGVKARLGRAGEMHRLGAAATAQEEEVTFASPSPDPVTVAHEMAHVVQKRFFRSAPQRRLSARDDPSEVEARSVAQDAAAGRPVKITAAPSAEIQRITDDELDQLVAELPAPVRTQARAAFLSRLGSGDLGGVSLQTARASLRQFAGTPGSGATAPSSSGFSSNPTPFLLPAHSPTFPSLLPSFPSLSSSPLGYGSSPSPSPSFLSPSHFPVTSSPSFSPLGYGSSPSPSPSFLSPSYFPVTSSPSFSPLGYGSSPSPSPFLSSPYFSMSSFPSSSPLGYGTSPSSLSRYRPIPSLASSSPSGSLASSPSPVFPAPLSSSIGKAPRKGRMAKTARRITTPTQAAGPSSDDVPDPSYDLTHGGLFDPSKVKFSKGGLHGQIKKISKRHKRESEHMLPKQVWNNTLFARSQDKMPALSIDYDDHRRGQSGAGGGVTSTGSSDVAKEWRARLHASIVSGDTFGAIRNVVLDELNSTWPRGQNINGILDAIDEYTGIIGSNGKPMLTKDQAAELKNLAASIHWHEAERS